MAGVVAADQVTKTLALRLLHTLHPIKIIPSFFWLTLCYNAGAAFSLFSEHPVLLTSFNIIATGLLLWWGVRIPRKEKRLKTALGLITGGACGNLCDRFFRGGFVVDFLDLHWFNRVHWPTFNLADTAICIGVGLIFLDLIFQPGKSGIAARAK